MRRLALSVLLLASACARSARWPPAPEAWREVRSEPCGFTVRMPGRARSRETKDPRGIRITQYAVRLRPGYVYTALCAVPVKARENESGETVVARRLEAERRAVEEHGWTVRDSRLLRVGTCPASELASVDPKGVEFRTRFVWAGDRSFFLGASGPAGAGGPETAAIMFDSFRAGACAEPPAAS